MSDDPFHDWDAAYVLGMLGPDDRRDFERHLATCQACSAAVAELAGVPGILGTLSRDEAVALSAEADTADAQIPPQDPELVTRLAVAAGRRRHRVRIATAGAGVAAAAALLVGGFAVGNALDSSPGQPATVAMAEVQPGTMTADISVSKKAWGTRFDWSCHYLNTAAWNGSHPRYELVATSKDGTQTVVASWSASSSKATALAASSSLPTSSIRSVEIRILGSAQPLTSLNL
jgi:hypothetical protein